MLEQEINYHSSPPQGQQQQIAKDQQVNGGRGSMGMSTAMRSQRLVHRYLPPSSLNKQPSSQSSSLVLHRAEPIFKLESSLHDRQRLSMERQLMYCRGLGDELSCDDIVGELIEQSRSQKGYINKRGNRSIIVNQLFVYAYQQCLKAVQMPKYNNNFLLMYQQTLAPLTLLTFPTGTDILELQSVAQNHSNTKHNALLISIRLSRQIIIFDLLSGQITSKISTQSSSEFIATAFNSNTNQHSLLQTVQYNATGTLIKLWNLNTANTPFLHKQIQVLKLLVNSITKLTTNTSLIATYDSLKLHDYRINKVTTQYTVSQQERLYSMQRLAGQYTYSPYIATSHTRHISLFDIRKLSSPILRKPHHCEESPLQNIHYFDGQKLKLDKPVIISWSPYYNGSALMVDVNFLNTDGFRSQKQTLNQEHNRILRNNDNTIKNNMLLGKHFHILPHYISPPNTNHSKLSLYTDSISLHNYSSSCLAVLAVSNQGTINMHMYNHSQDKDHYYPQQVKEYQLKQHQQQTHSIDEWFTNNLLQKYFKKDTNHQQILPRQQHKPSTQKTGNKKKNYQKNHRVKPPTNRTQSNLSKSLKRSNQEQLLFKSQFQNDDQCEQSYHKRKLNFVDLANFYQLLQTKAHRFPQSHILKPNQLESSFTSTQPYSQNYSFSSSFSDDSFTATNLLNKKTIDSSLLDHLKSQWGQ